MNQLAVFVAGFAFILTGCSVPPDWSICECHWLDNIWFHHITMLDKYTGDTFVHSLVNPNHELHAWVLKQQCPQQVSESI